MGFFFLYLSPEKRERDPTASSFFFCGYNCCKPFPMSSVFFLAVCALANFATVGDGPLLREHLTFPRSHCSTVEGSPRRRTTESFVDDLSSLREDHAFDDPCSRRVLAPQSRLFSPVNLGLNCSSTTPAAFKYAPRDGNDYDEVSGLRDGLFFDDCFVRISLAPQCCSFFSLGLGSNRSATPAPASRCAPNDYDDTVTPLLRPLPTLFSFLSKIIATVDETLVFSGGLAFNCSPTIPAAFIYVLRGENDYDELSTFRDDLLFDVSNFRDFLLFDVCCFRSFSAPQCRHFSSVGLGSNRSPTTGCAPKAYDDTVALRPQARPALRTSSSKSTEYVDYGTLFCVETFGRKRNSWPRPVIPLGRKRHDHAATVARLLLPTIYAALPKSVKSVVSAVVIVFICLAHGAFRLRRLILFTATAYNIALASYTGDPASRTLMMLLAASTYVVAFALYRRKTAPICAHAVEVDGAPARVDDVEEVPVRNDNNAPLAASSTENIEGASARADAVEAFSVTNHENKPPAASSNDNVHDTSALNVDASADVATATPSTTPKVAGHAPMMLPLDGEELDASLAAFAATEARLLLVRLGLLLATPLDAPKVAGAFKDSFLPSTPTAASTTASFGLRAQGVSRNSDFA